MPSARDADFFSIGTNDLTQYTLAMDRTHPRLAPAFDALHPAVLRLIDQTVTGAHARQRWVGVCGSLAGDPQAVADPDRAGRGRAQRGRSRGSGDQDTDSLP